MGASPTAQAMFAMVVAAVLLPLGDTISKLLTGFAHPMEVSTLRVVTQAAVLVPLALLTRTSLRGAFSPIVFVAGFCFAMVSFALIASFKAMPIATAISIFFIEPLLLTLLARPLLGEKVGLRRYLAVGVGLIGAVIVIRPNFATFGWVALMPALAALAFALNMAMVRRASRTRAPLTIQVGATLYGVGVMGVATLGAQQLGWISFGFGAAPDWAWGAVLVAGALAALTFLLIGFAFSRAEASLLAPFQYLEIVGAVIFGWLVFNDLPDALTCLGTAIILAAGIYVFHRERKVQSEP
jgi:drug/metabolite transporter (DMT)-like permease